MVPLPRFRQQATRQYVVGEEYALVVDEDRSDASHGEYFGLLTDAWRNFPEDVGVRFPTVEHLRKRALIETGYHDERTYACDSELAAYRIAAFVKPLDDYAIILISGTVVRVYTAKSQKYRAMGKKTFERSKEDVLQYACNFIGVTVESLRRNAKRAA
jgi:hypothetical protein